LPLVENAKGLAACKIICAFRLAYNKKKTSKERWRRQRGARQLKRKLDLDEVQSKLSKIEVRRIFNKCYSINAQNSGINICFIISFSIPIRMI
jgi:hypothetical protein